MATRCFWLEPTDTVRRWLRRYTSNHSGKWTCADGWHEAFLLFGDAPAIWEDSEFGTRKRRVVRNTESDRPIDDDMRWPVKCDKCDFRFAPNEVRQFFYALLYKRADTGEVLPLRDAPPGAMWDAWWLHDLRGGYLPGNTPDGRVIMVKCPNGHDWCIDSRASNCTLPNDNDHHCWIRHGEPPDLVVDKSGGPTCSAGAGSIMAGDYHGFLGIGGAAPGWFT